MKLKLVISSADLQYSTEKDVKHRKDHCMGRMYPERLARGFDWP